MIANANIDDDYFITVALGAAKIRLAGTDRGPDELPREAFLAQLPGRLPMLGEWRQRWADNGNDFDVEVVSFGYLPSYGLEVPLGRQTFNKEERAVAEHLIRGLFSNKAATQKHAAFMPQRRGVFLGNVHFLWGWITFSDAGFIQEGTRSRN